MLLICPHCQRHVDCAGCVGTVACPHCRQPFAIAAPAESAPIGLTGAAPAPSSLPQPPLSDFAIRVNATNERGGKHSRARSKKPKTPWKIVAGAMILLLAATWPMLLALLFGFARNDLLTAVGWTVVATAIVAGGFVVALLEAPAVTWLFVILLTGILPGMVVIGGWCALLEGFGYECHPWIHVPDTRRTSPSLRAAQRRP